MAQRRNAYDQGMCQPAGCSRRQLLRVGAAVAASTVARPLSSISVAAAIGTLSPLPIRPGARIAMVGVPRHAVPGALEGAIREAALTATDFSWLKPGDRVLLKPVSNSPNPYPATTHPAAVAVMASLLRERGAAVYVGEQSGLQFVYFTPQSHHGSTRTCLRNNGLEQAGLAENAEVVCFEEAGYQGYFAAAPPTGCHFKSEIFLPKLVTEVDHIIYLPRISKHILAGSTLGLKVAVGWLREDSRHELHRAGATFAEKVADINGCREIRERLRLVLSVGTRVQTSFGPDNGHVATPEVGLVIASENVIDHDLASFAYLLEVSAQTTPWSGRAFDPYPTLSSFINRTFVSYIWGAGNFMEAESVNAPRLDSPWACRVLRRGCEIFGGRPERLAIENVSQSVPGPLLDAIIKRAAYPA